GAGHRRQRVRSRHHRHRQRGDRVHRPGRDTDRNRAHEGRQPRHRRARRRVSRRSERLDECRRPRSTRARRPTRERRHVHVHGAPSRRLLRVVDPRRSGFGVAGSPGAGGYRTNRDAGTDCRWRHEDTERRPDRWRSMKAISVAAFTLAAVLSSPICGSAQVRDLPKPARDNAALPAGTASVVGTILTDTEPPRPVRRAIVTVNSSDRSVGKTVVTDDTGRYAVTGLPAGRYNLDASKRGWVSISYGSKGPGRAGTAVAL